MRVGTVADRLRDTLLSPRAITGAVGPDYANAPDAELISAGNADAFAVVYDRQAAAVYRWARARVGDHAADLTAETFARAWLSRGAFKDRAEGSAFPWLLGIAQNVLRDSLRRKRIEDKARAKLGLPLQVAPDPGYDLVEERLSVPEAALKALADLPEPDRKVLDMRVVEGRSYDEIAASLKCTQVAARLRVSRALRRLNIAIGEQQ
jgi:RNA polymerase sigma factor (sigma-70 family)